MDAPRRSRALAAGLLTMVLAAGAGCVPGDGPEEQGPDRDIPLPASMAALGDSITRALSACERLGDCSRSSWSTGAAPELRSHRQRVAEARGDAVEAHNVAMNGGRVADLRVQVRKAVAAEVEYVTVLIGANDACAATADAMTSLDRFDAEFTRALDALVAGLPRARILVVSIPDLARLWQVGRDDAGVRGRWEALGICPSMLEEPTSDREQARDRRALVRDRVVGYNRAMAAACQRHATCRWDDNAVFDYDFSLEMVSARDYWHPSQLGQRTLAEITWKAGYWG